MSDGQYPPESPQDPVNAPQEASSENSSQEPGLAPIGASTPGEWPQNPDESVIDVPEGGQYPEDMFGVDDATAEVSFPADASAGGLADVGLSYGDGSVGTELPPPAEPQPLTEFAIDPIPAPQNDAGGGDLFSVDEFIEAESEPAFEQAAPPPPLAAPADGGDMFSIDELSGATPEPAEQTFEPPPVEPLSVEPLAVPEPLEDPEPLPVETAFDMGEPAPVEPISTVPGEYDNPETSADVEPPLNDRALVFSKPTGESPPLAGEEVANPYAAVPDAADVLDPAAGSGDEPEVDPDIPTQIVNPYAEVSTEAQVIDPAMALSQTEGVVEETEHEVFMRSDPTIQPEPEPQDPNEPNADQPLYQDYNAGSAYGDVELPATDRTESVAPPGMEGLVVGGLVVADGGKGVKAAAAKGKKAKGGAFGMGKKKQAEPQGEQYVDARAMPEPSAYDTNHDPSAFAPAGAAPIQPSTGVYAEPGESTAQAGPVQQKSFFGIKYGKAGGSAPKAKKVDQKSFFGIKYGGTELAPKPPMPGTPAAQATLAPAGKTVKVDQKSFFGIKYGGTVVEQAPAPQAYAEQSQGAAAQPVAPQPVAPQPDSFAVPPAPYADETVPAAAAPNPYAQAPVAQAYAEQPVQQQAQVIHSAEAAAHNNKRGKKQKALKQQMIDQKSFFGIKYGGTPVNTAPAAAPTPAAPAGKPVKVDQKSFFGIKYGGTVVEQTAAGHPAAPAAPAGKPVKVDQKSFFGIKYGGTVAQQAPAPVAAQPQFVPAPTPVAAPVAPAYAPQQPVSAVAAAPTAFPGGYAADFASNAAHAPAAATAAMPTQTPEQIMPPVAQTAQQNPLQAQPPLQ